MTTATLDLCKELYELSGWECDWFWVGWSAQEMDYPDDWNWRETHAEQQGFYSMDGSIEAKFKQEDRLYPAYNLGYLLRKLPPFLFSADNRASHLTICADQQEWIASYDYNDDELAENINFADTPENALCALAIELFKQKVLK